MRGLVSVFIAALTLAACTSVPAVPEQVTVVVEKYRDLPSWATAALAKPEPIDGTVEGRVRSHDQRGTTIDLANCHRHLLAKLDKGEAVDKQECER